MRTIGVCLFVLGILAMGSEGDYFPIPNLIGAVLIITLYFFAIREDC